MNRRGFLTGLAGCFAAAAAPAIVTEPMKLWVPKQEVLTLEWGLDFGKGAFTAELWLENGVWQHVAVVQKKDRSDHTAYVNGVQVPLSDRRVKSAADAFGSALRNELHLVPNNNIAEIRLTRGACRDPVVEHEMSLIRHKEQEQWHRTASMPLLRL